MGVLTLLRRWMERSMSSDPATRRVSTVATDHVGVSASDRISPCPVTAAWLSSPPAILSQSRRETASQDAQKGAAFRSSSPRAPPPIFPLQ